MIPHISDELVALSLTCQTDGLAPTLGWSIDLWQLSPEALFALKRVYLRSLMPKPLEEILDTLAIDGINLSDVFLEVDDADSENLARITRADMLEFAAAASMLAIEGLPIQTLVMPNVPKRSRKQSSPGIDVMAARLIPEKGFGPLRPNETLYLGSVKHTTADVSDLRYKLNKSVSENELTIPYLATQLRAFHGELEGRGISANRLFLFLGGSPILEGV